MRKIIPAFLLSVLLVTAPWVVFKLAVGPAADWGILSQAYLVLTLLLVGWRFYLVKLGPVASGIGVVSYIASGFIALVLAATSGAGYLLVAGVFMGVLVYGVGYMEKADALIYPASALLYLGLAQLITVEDWSGGEYASLLLVSGAFIFAAGYLLERALPKRAELLRHAGLIGPFLGALLCAVADPSSQMTIIAMGVGGCLLWGEAYMQRSVALQEMAGGLLLAAYDWMLVYNQVSEVQVYSIPWVVYFAWLSTRRKKGSNGYYILVGASLAVLTFPLAFLALGDNGQFYGLELIFLGLALAVIGSAQLNKLVLWWGGGAAMVELLYLIPRYLVPGTDVPYIAASIGLVAYALAVIVRANRES